MQIMKVETTAREQMINITAELQDVITDRDWNYGVLTLYCPHTTVSLLNSVGKDKSVGKDIMDVLDKLFPYSGNYQHKDNADAHIKSALMGNNNLQFIVINGQIMLGEWQGVFFCEFDGPRSRELWLKWQAS